MWSQMSNGPPHPPPSSDDVNRRFPPAGMPPPTAANRPPPAGPPNPHMQRRQAPARSGSGQGIMFPPPPTQPQDAIHPSASSDHESYRDEEEDDSDDGALGATINLVTSAASMFFRGANQQQRPPASPAFPPPPQVAEPPRAPPAPIEPVSSMLDHAPPMAASAAAVAFSAEPPTATAPFSAVTPTRSGSFGSAGGKPPVPMFRPPSQPSTPVTSGRPAPASIIQPSSSFGSQGRGTARVSPMPSPRLQPGQPQNGSPRVAMPVLGIPQSAGGIAANNSTPSTMFRPPTPPSQQAAAALFGGNPVSGPPPAKRNVPMQPPASPRPNILGSSASAPVAPSNVMPQSVFAQSAPQTATATPNAQALFGNPPPTPNTLSSALTQSQQPHQQSAVEGNVFGKPTPPTPATTPIPGNKPTNEALLESTKLPPPEPTPTQASTIYEHAAAISPQTPAPPSANAAALFAPPVPSLQTIDSAAASRPPPTSTSFHAATPPASPKVRYNATQSPKPPTPETGKGVASAGSTTKSTPVGRRLRAPPPVSKTLLATPSTAAASASSATKTTRSKFRLPTPRKRVPPISAVKSNEDATPKMTPPEVEDNKKDKKVMEQAAAQSSQPQRNGHDLQQSPADPSPAFEEADTPSDVTSIQHTEPVALPTGRLKSAASEPPKIESNPDVVGNGHENPEETIPLAEDPNGEPHDVSKANPPLPEGWSEAVDPSSGQTYFFNVVTNDTSWERPVTSPNLNDGMGSGEESVADTSSAEPQIAPEEAQETPAETEDPFDSAIDALNAEFGIEQSETEDSVPLLDPRSDESPENIDNEESVEESTELNEVKAALPEGWIEEVDTSTGNKYYYHHASGTVTWERPTESQSSVQVDHEETMDQTETSGPTEGDQADDQPEMAVEHVRDQPLDDEENLPVGWKLNVDPSTGQTYYYNTDSGESSWTHPYRGEMYQNEVVEARNEISANDSASYNPQEDELEEVQHQVDFQDENAGDNSMHPTANEVMPSETDSEESQETENKPVVGSNPAPEITPLTENTEEPETNASAAETSLPSEWIEQLDPSSERTYYYNSSTNHVSWERPVASVETTDQNGHAEARTSLEATVDVVESPEEVAIESHDYDSDHTSSNSVEDLPEGWSETMEPRSGKIYYFNEITGESSWEKPSAQFAAAAVEAFLESDITSQDVILANDLESETEETEQQLATPETTTAVSCGWTKCTDEDSGDFFYYNRVTGETSWERPSAFECDDGDLPLEEAVEQKERENDLPDETENMEPAEDALPCGWNALSTPDGTPYYYNEITGDVSWDKPQTPQASPRLMKGETSNSDPTYEMDVIEEFVDQIEPLPDGWVEDIDDDGNISYYHSESGTFTEERPTSGVAVGKLDVEHSEEKSGTVDIPDPQSTDVATLRSHDNSNPDDLPDGWTQSCTENGEVYYYHSASGDVSWEKPTSGISTLGAQETIEFSVDNFEAAVKSNVADQASDSEPVVEIATEKQSEDWVEAVDPSSGRKYYCNSRTGETSWEKPGDGRQIEVMDDEVAGQELEKSAEVTVNVTVDGDEPERTSVKEAGMDAEASPSDLPENWVETNDPSSGVYYYNAVTGESSWERPTVYELSGAPQESMTSEVEVSADEVEPELLEESSHVNSPEDHRETADETELTPSQPKKEEMTHEAFSHDNSSIDGNMHEDKWTEMEDPSSGKVYFYNRHTGEATWENPMSNEIPEFAGGISAGEVVEQNLEAADLVLNDDALPEGWVESQDPSSGQTYYFHIPSGQTSWDRPPNDAEESDAESTESDGDDDSSGDSNTSSDYEDDEVEKEADNTPAQLPDGWEMVVDSGSDEVYYYNRHTKKTCWEIPTEVAETNEEPKAVVDAATNGEGIEDGWEEVSDPAGHAEISEEKPLEDEIPLAEGWVENVASSGQVFYWNEHTNDTSWDRPTVPAVAPQIDESPIVVDRPSDTSKVEPASLLAESDKEVKADKQLPEPWIEVTDPGTGDVYYHNPFTQETSWERPAREEITDVAVETSEPSAHPGPAFQGNRQGRNGTPLELIAKLEKERSQFGIEGPFGLSENSTVVAYIEHKAKTSDILWQLIAIASKSQGRLRGDRGVSDKNSPESAIVQLLLSDDKVLSKSKLAASMRTKSSVSSVESDDSMFRVQNLLLRGDKIGAIDEAISADDFATALFIAGMCSPGVHKRVSQQFAESKFKSSSPMYTAALLFTGALQPPSQPPSGRSSGNWGVPSNELKETWKSHLAAIISNRTPGWDKVVLSLGDRLFEIGDIKPAHFCYMIYGQSKRDGGYQAPLLGCDHSDVASATLSSQEALAAYERTEAFEWAKRLGNKNASLVDFQPYKLIYAMLLMDCGMLKQAERCLIGVRAPADTTADPTQNMETVTLNQLFCDYGAFNLTRLELEMQISSQRDSGFDFHATFLIGKDLNVKAALHQTSASSTHTATPIPAQNDHKQAAYPDLSDPNSSFLSARSNLMEKTGYSLDSPDQQTAAPKRTERISMPPLPEGCSERNADRLTLPPTPVTQPTQAAFIAAQPPAVVPNQPPREAQTQTAAMPPATFEKKIPQMTMATPQERKRPKSPPTTAPPRIGGKKEEAPRTPAAPSSGGIFSGLKSMIVKKLNPDATECHLPDSGEQPYYDKKIGRWIFPGDDPDEVAKPLPPPPTTIPKNDLQTKPETSLEERPKDPLAAMMAPPSRAPSALKRTGAGTRTTPGQYPPGMLPLGPTSAATSAGSAPLATAGAPPPFAVFTPKPAAKQEKE